MQDLKCRSSKALVQWLLLRSGPFRTQPELRRLRDSLFPEAAILVLLIVHTLTSLKAWWTSRRGFRTESSLKRSLKLRQAGMALW